MAKEELYSKERWELHMRFQLELFAQTKLEFDDKPEECYSDDADEMCEDCTCWKFTRIMCS